MKNKNFLLITIGIIIAIAIIIMAFILGSNLTGNIIKEPKPFCGDSICNGNENKCSCSSDCGSCSGLKECSYYSCDYNSQECVPEGEPVSNCCGNYVCEVNENSVSCSKNCGEPKTINSEWEAIDKLETRKDIVQEWESMTKQYNCGTRYLDISNSAYFIARVTVSQNLIECNKFNHFNNMMTISNKYREDYNNNLKTCSEELIGIFNKELRGYDSNGNFELNEQCFDCNDFYAIYFGCINADVDISDYSNQEEETSSYQSGVSIVRNNYDYTSATAVVDAKTGAVYW